MNWNKIIKYGFLYIFMALLGKILVQELFDFRPFKFEKYRSDAQLQEASKLRFSVGSNVNEARITLEKSGAKCDRFKTSEGKLYTFIISCEYNTGLFSMHPLEYYRISLCGNADQKLVEVETLRVTGLTLVIA